MLAEGVNLHRANVIVNYDSPWNATRLMQRIGRVNRIGSTAEAIHNYMFYPSEPAARCPQKEGKTASVTQGRFLPQGGNLKQILPHIEKNVYICTREQ